ncbi:unnamed protein product [Caenorhabditis brenneri]
MNHLIALRDKFRAHVLSIDPYAALGIFIVTAVCVFAFCFASAYHYHASQDRQNQQHKQHHYQNFNNFEYQRPVPEHPLRKMLSLPQNKNSKRKRRFVKKEIKHMENEEKNRKKEEKREESKAERNKQKKADSGQQKQFQKTSFKRIGAANGLENGGGRAKQQTTAVRNVPRKRS